MTINIHIEAHPNRGDMGAQIDDALAAIGFIRKPPTLRQVADAAYDAGYEVRVDLEQKSDATEATADNRSPVGMADEADKRAIGEAGGGRKRRTKDEIAADEALTALGAAKGIQVDALARAIAQVGRAATEVELRKQPDADKAAISTGENRVDPENPEPEDDEATQAQDAADEAAEVEATRKADTTIDDVKAAVQLYVDKFGLKVTQEDGPKIFVEALGAPPAGEAFWKFSILPTDADKLAKVVSVWKRAAAENPLKREAR